MTPINRIEPVSRVSAVSRIEPIQKIERTTPVTLTGMKQELLVLQYQASKYNSWEYYQQILELQEDIRCRQEIMEKYPYDGKSTFAELLAQEIKKK